MRRLLTTSVVACCVAAVAFAAAPVGTASSSAAFDLNGVAMPPEGVSSWPVTAGDELRAGGATVVLRFQDGSRIVISEQSRVKLGRNGDTVSVNLAAGAAQFNLAPESALQVLNQGRQVGGRSGSITAGTRAGGTQAGVGSSGGPQAEIRRPPPPISTK
ncbi:MAG TPA: FecR domain-containing protein [Bryobacteraceae bacterium]|nr:FecR domain-containing protein [Bryobacteraceae bacterium]